MLDGITQCYLPPGRGDIPAFIPEKGIPAKLVHCTRSKKPGGMQGRFDLVDWLHTEMVYPPEDGHPSQH